MTKSIVAVIAEGYEDMELWYPKLRLEEEGWHVTVVGPEAGMTYQGKHGYPCEVDAAISEVNGSAFDALLLPGGFAPDKLRRDSDVLKLVREFHRDGKLIAFICHAGWILASAKILEGRRITSTFRIKDDMENAGAVWLDEPLVEDDNLISSRHPGDLPLFAKAMVHWFKKSEL
jgi:protease I